MFTKFYKFINLILNPKVLQKLLSMYYSGYLVETGWIASFKNQQPMDRHLNPIPWVTYSFIDFISYRLNHTMDIFEYGSGNSTLWYAKHVNSVTSVEHDKEWFNKVQKSIPSNVTLFYKELIYDSEYSTCINTTNQKFDLIIVDGRDRVNCIKSALVMLKEDGIIILDDSERDIYKEGIQYLQKSNFKQIDFWGIAPGIFFNKCTSIFYREINCIQL